MSEKTPSSPLGALSGLFRKRQEAAAQEPSLYGEHPLQARIDAMRQAYQGHAPFTQLKQELMSTSGQSPVLNLCGANLQGFKAICGDDWDDVILEGADISYGSVHLTKHHELEMVNMNASYADIVSPEGATLKAERSCLVGARLRGSRKGEGASFGRLEVNDSDARAADLSGARVYHLEARGADFSGANFSGATITGDMSSWA